MSQFPVYLDHNPHTSLLSLPNEILYSIIKDLPLPTMTALSETSRFISAITSPILTNLKKADHDGIPAIHYASSQGSLTWVMSLLSLGVSPSLRIPKTFGTPLHFAASKGHKDIVLCLIESNADINATDLFGDTPLHVAVQDGMYECVEELVKHGANVDVLNCNGESPLRKGIEVLHRLGRSEDPHDIIRFKNMENAVMVLLSGGVDVRKVDESRQTVLHFAASQKSVLVLEKILSLGAKADINAQESFNLTPLHIAAIEGYYGCAAALLRSGALVDAQTREGNTALHVALMAENRAAVQTLVDGKADPNIFNNAGYTPLSLAAYFGHTRYVLMMCKGVTPINWSSDCNALALFMAATQRHETVVKVLLHNGAKDAVNVQWKSSNARTALHEAVRNGDSGIVWLLIRHGADIWIPDGEGKCGGCWAYEKGHFKMIRMFHIFS
ncbi:uncharacterized protein H6S33_008623 [Morchella sextelata]|uniref:uncharacterized protein n=1 Tax=Morchella sextelata TaxID=1174677 RepID=UPI001D03D02D|nr:uncharacterized protein H6S33_008623 [Morchella sextelata]KAH0602542.1 hypothetical protein H6S33_008623 [Morchella sextelata]